MYCVNDKELYLLGDMIVQAKWEHVSANGVVDDANSTNRCVVEFITRVQITWIICNYINYTN